jgi:hypothetical protein
MFNSHNSIKTGLDDRNKQKKNLHIKHLIFVAKKLNKTLTFKRLYKKLCKSFKTTLT